MADLAKVETTPKAGQDNGPSAIVETDDVLA